MNIKDLDFTFPEDLIATKPQWPPRVMWVDARGKSSEISFAQLLSMIPPGDALLINDTQVLKRRVFAGRSLQAAKDIEVLFLNSLGSQQWEVLFPAKSLSLGAKLYLPDQVGKNGVVQKISMTLIQKGRPQKVKIEVFSEEDLVPMDADIGEDYFSMVAELPLPPYIQKARSERHNVEQDKNWYQTAWATKPGSFAAPTASLHFRSEDIQSLKDRGVQVLPLTLHVGLGTFLPVTTEKLEDHVMHAEYIEIPCATIKALQQVKAAGGRVWTLGSTATRSIESWAQGLLKEDTVNQCYKGFSDLFIQPGYKYNTVDFLMTNFHQPQSTLVAMVAAFAGLDQVRQAYQWAIENRFRLFSYGDFSVWQKAE
ncbi:MAG: tRNA preQ1(34) S-adenosylmethionine ribosyltransferase-isomerase QueA [Pseudobdellovibrionaceae bacterium]